MRPRGRIVGERLARTQFRNEVATKEASRPKDGDSVPTDCAVSWGSLADNGLLARGSHQVMVGPLSRKKQS